MRLSICIPTRNTARYLPQAIESVLVQDFTDFELVICDNASDDDTPDLVRNYSDFRIRYLRFDELVNQAGSFNRCLAAARGELIAILHSDDFYLPGFVSDRVVRFDTDSSLGMVFGAVEIIDKDGNPVSTSRHWAEDRKFAYGDLVHELVLACIVSPPSLMVRRSVVELAGQFRSDLTWGHDWEWSIRIAEHAAALYTARTSAAYRVHDASGTAEILNAAKNGQQERRILSDTFDRIGGIRSQRRSAYRALSRRQMYFAEQSLFAGRKVVARNNLWYSLLADASMAFKPTFWALLAGTLGSANLYRRYRQLRGAEG